VTFAITFGLAYIYAADWSSARNTEAELRSWSIAGIIEKEGGYEP
jgi:hypothetical protein